MIAAETAQLARRAVDALPDDYRRILELTRARGLSIEEAAAEMGRTVEATRKLCSRAICRFRVIFTRLSDESSATS